MFGAVLIAGAVVLVDRLLAPENPHAGIALLGTWTIAILAGLAAMAAIRGEPASGDTERIFVASFVVPTIGVALLLPLTLHLPIVALGWGVDAFDDWAALSLMITGPAHVVFAWLAATRAKQLARGELAITPTKIFAITIAASAIPFAVLYMIPPILVGVTGLPILVLLDRMERLVARESSVHVPTAIAHFAH